jgi:hypothetical protein
MQRDMYMAGACAHNTYHVDFTGEGLFQRLGRFRGGRAAARRCRSDQVRPHEFLVRANDKGRVRVVSRLGPEMYVPEVDGIVVKHQGGARHEDSKHRCKELRLAIFTR